jgi:hypothetical protein
MSLFDIDLPDLLGDALGDLLLPGVLHRATLAEDEDGRRTRTLSDEPIRYMREAISDYAWATAGIPSTTVRVLILAQGLGSPPSVEDEVTIDAGRYRIARCDADPASATYTVDGNPV